MRPFDRSSSLLREGLLKELPGAVRYTFKRYGMNPVVGVETRRGPLTPGEAAFVDRALTVYEKHYVPWHSKLKKFKPEPQTRPEPDPSNESIPFAERKATIQSEQTSADELEACPRNTSTQYPQTRVLGIFDKIRDCPEAQASQLRSWTNGSAESRPHSTENSTKRIRRPFNLC